MPTSCFVAISRPARRSPRGADGDEEARFEQVHLHADLVGDPDQRGVREGGEVEVADERSGVVRPALVGGIDRLEVQVRRPRRSDHGQGGNRSHLRVRIVDRHRPGAVRAPVRGPPPRPARRAVDRPDLRPGFDAAAVASKVGSSMS
jgi:hypothetical protein